MAMSEPVVPTTGESKDGSGQEDVRPSVFNGLLCSFRHNRTVSRARIGPVGDGNCYNMAAMAVSTDSWARVACR